MDHFAGMDVSVKETSVCIVDDAGTIVREAKVASGPVAVAELWTSPGFHFKRIGMASPPAVRNGFTAHLPKQACR